MLSCVVSKHGNVIIISEISSFVLVFSSVKSWKMEGTVFTPCLEGMKHVKSEQGEMLTMPFLDLCKTLFPVLGNKRIILFCFLNASYDSDIFG